MTQEELELSLDKLEYDRIGKPDNIYSLASPRRTRLNRLKDRARSLVRLASMTHKEEDRLEAAQAIENCRAAWQEMLEEVKDKKDIGKEWDGLSWRFFGAVTISIVMGIILICLWRIRGVK